MPRARPSVGRIAEPFGDPFGALSSCRKYESEHEGCQHFPRVTSGPEPSGGWIRYCTARRGPDPTPSPCDPQIKQNDREEAAR